MAKYGKGNLSSSIEGNGIAKPKQSLIEASQGFEGGMEGLVERAKEHGVGGWGHEAFGDNYYTDLKSDRGIASYLASQDKQGNYDPRIWQPERPEEEAAKEELANNPEAQAEIEPKMQPITYSSAVQDAKERTKAFIDGSQESYNIYTGAASTKNNQVEDSGSAMSVANNKTSTMNQGQSDPMLQSRHEDRNLNFR